MLEKIERNLMKGNEALAEAAIRADCKCFFGYPITPQTELAAYMAKRMPKVNGVFLQAESEIAAINMVLGAASTGVRAMTSSSSPGISLKSEGISYLAASDVPALIVNVQRGGPGLGGIQPSQADYWQATRAMGHGDFHILVFAPASVQEMVDMVSKAFDTAEKYRMPAMLLADGLLGQMMEPVSLPEPSKSKCDKSAWAADGHKLQYDKVESVVNKGRPTYLQIVQDMYLSNRPFYDRLANRLGYYFRLRRTVFTDEICNGDPCDIRLTFRNDGVAPIYIPAGVKIGLLDRDYNLIKAYPISADPGEWMPGENVTVSAAPRLTLPNGTPSGEYILAVGIFTNDNDDKPDIRLGSTGGTEDNWYAFGTVKVNSK